MFDGIDPSNRNDLIIGSCGSCSGVVGFYSRVCHIPAQRQQLLQDSKASADMIRITAMRPEDRKREVQKQAQSLISDNKSFYKQFGVEINTQMVQVEGRVLKPPDVFYAKGQYLSPQKGSWNLVNHVLHTPSPRWELHHT